MALESIQSGEPAIADPLRFRPPNTTAPNVVEITASDSTEAAIAPAQWDERMLPDQLRKLPVQQLPEICSSLRHTLIDSVSHSGGHFAAGLGVVELTVALHYVFNTPSDPLIWDIGHQCYPHKILTGRLAAMRNIRKHHGVSGFPTRQESPFDAFGVAHAGTSISAALGMAVSCEEQQRVVCVIGDGALTEGMAFEALNHAGSMSENLLIVLNDNGMSISPNVGALSRQQHLEGFFHSLGCYYRGPVDGHNVTGLVDSCRQLKNRSGISVLHTITRKGHGYTPAERDPVKYHAVPPFNPDTGVCTKNTPKPMTYTHVFGQWLCDAAAGDERVVAITPAMREGSGLAAFEKQFPNRYHDVGIAEQHAVTFAAGLACQQKKPVVAIYSSFLQRAYDQFIHDIALQDLDVLLAIDRAGLVGADGATHHGSFDLSFLRCIPNLVLMAPSSERECRKMLQTGLQHNGPAAVRYERGSGPGVLPDDSLSTLNIGKGAVLRTGKNFAILCFGNVLGNALPVADALDATLVNMRFIKPLDIDLIEHLSQYHSTFITLENNAIAGGAGSAVAEAVNRLGIRIDILNLGYPDTFVEHGTQQELLAELKLDSAGILEQIDQFQQRNLKRQQSSNTCCRQIQKTEAHEPEIIADCAAPRVL